MRSKSVSSPALIITAFALMAAIAVLVFGSDSHVGVLKTSQSPQQASRYQAENRFVDASNAKESDRKFVPDQLMVRFRSDVTNARQSNVLRKHQMRRIKTMPIDGMVLVGLPADSNERVIARRLETDPAIDYAQTNNIYRLTATPNDPSLSQLWALNNTGQTVNSIMGVADADVDGLEAWDRYVGTSSTRVAVVDTGVDYGHADLAANIWSNSGETGGGKESNGVDDDGNGFIDDFRGWDFVDANVSAPAPDNNPMDNHGHGTHVAGTIGAVGNNGVGIAGINWSTSIVPVRALDNNGYGSDATIVPALVYAGKHAGVVNGSFGGPYYSQAERDAISSNPRALYVFAAGNANNDNDANPFYPCSFGEPNVVCVAATTSTDARASFSNYGATTVDLGAPGANIYSTVPGNNYAYYSGTSMASPHVAGAAALLRGFEPSASVSLVKDVLLTSTDPLPALVGRTVSGGRLNLAKAVDEMRPEDNTARVQSGGGRLSYLAGNGVANNVSITLSGSTYTVVDSVATVTVGAGCTQTNSHTATCSSAGIASINASTGDLDDVISSSSATPATISTGPGNDTITGGSGSDKFDGGTGADVFNGGSGVDTVDYSIRSGSLTVTIDGVANDGEAGESDNVKADIENVTGGDGSDSLTGNAAANVLGGGAGDDTLAGLDGNDTLLPGFGTDSVDGGAGNDTASYADRASSVTVSLDGVANDGAAGENDSITTSVENLTGGEGDDEMSGSAGDNTISGGPGDDRLRPGAGADVVDGGGGTDTAVYTERTSTVIVSLDGLANDGASNENDNVASDVESIASGSGDDTLTGNSADNTFDGGTGNDVFNGLGGTDTVTYAARGATVTASIDGAANDGAVGESDNINPDVENLIGGSADDSLTGSAAANRIAGGPGDDALDGGDGDDEFVGGDGDDTYSGGSGSDTVDYSQRFTWEQAIEGLVSNGVDVTIDNVANDGLWYPQEADNVKTDVENVIGSDGWDSLVGSAADNRLDGGYSGDVLSGGDGNDVLVGGPSDESMDADADTFSGGAGDDRLESGNGGQTELYAEPGADTYVGNRRGTTRVSYAARTTSVSISFDGVANDGAAGENDNLIGAMSNVAGGSGDDTITAGSGVIGIEGGPGNDTLRGRLGFNVLHGGSGDDLLYPGARRSPLEMASAAYGESGNDTISFIDRTNGVNVSLDGYANDGEPNEGLSVFADIECIVGSNQGDTLTGNASANKLEGKDGPDNLVGDGGNDTLVGGSYDEETMFYGSNSYDGGSGDDTIRAAGLSEVLYAEPGADTYLGASSTTVTYADRTDAVNVSLDGVANDGAPGENDRVMNGILIVIGTPYADTLTGNNAINYLFGGSGNDSISGGLGGDFLSGEGGDDTINPGLKGGQWTDTIWGGAGSDTATFADRTANLQLKIGAGSNGESSEGAFIGNDVENLVGGSGNDTITGSAGDNVLTGGLGLDTILGLAGNDTILVRDSDDDPSPTCGDGTDSVVADALPFDVTNVDCESVSRP